MITKGYHSTLMNINSIEISNIKFILLRREYNPYRKFNTSFIFVDSLHFRKVNGATYFSNLIILYNSINCTAYKPIIHIDKLLDS